MKILLSDPFSEDAVSSVDWNGNDHSYEKYVFLWNAYTPLLDKIHKRLSGLCSQSLEFATTEYGSTKKQIEDWLKMPVVSKAWFKDMSRDEIGIISTRLERMRKVIIRARNPALLPHIQQLQPPGTRPQLPQPKQKRNMSVPRCEAASSPRIPEQHFMPISQANKTRTQPQLPQSKQRRNMSVLRCGVASLPRIPDQHFMPISQADKVKAVLVSSVANPEQKIGVLSMNKQTRPQVVQARNLTQPIQHTLLDPKKQPISVQNVASDPKVSSTLSPLSTSLSQNSLKMASTISPIRSAAGSANHPQPAKNNQILSQTTNKDQASSTGPPKIGVISMNRLTRHENLTKPIQHTLLHPKKQLMSVQNDASDPKVSSTPSPLSTASSQNSLEKSSTISPVLSAAGSANHHQPAKNDQILSQSANKDQAFSTGSPKILAASPLVADVTLPEEKQSGHSNESSIQRLLDVVKSISNRALFAALQDIDSMMNTMDPVDVNCESQASTDYLRDPLQGRNLYYLYGTASARRIERHFGVLKEITSSDGLQELSSRTNYLESNTECRTKMPEYQMNTAALLDEIEEINKRLVETALDLVLDESSTKSDSKAGSGKGTVIRCSYSPVGLGRNIELRRKSDSKLLPLFCVELLVPADYPKSCPVLLDNDSSLCGSLSEEEAVQVHDLTKKVNMKFSSSLCELPQPPSLKEMAKKWDDCARSVLSEFAVSTGGGTLSTKLGKWENCLNVDR